MNTLRLKLLAASMFVCATAFAQVPAASKQTNKSPDVKLPAPPTFGDNHLDKTAAQPVGFRGNDYKSDSYVLQNGLSQYANVTQQGYYNTADIYQNKSNTAGHDDNNATQSQTNDGRDNNKGKLNIAYIDQEGSKSSAKQTQYGTGNVASISQGEGSGNFAKQNQVGEDHQAHISQLGSKSNAMQSQTGGNLDVALINQGTGTNNTAHQKQLGGDGNQANISQEGEGLSGSFNDAYQYQKGSNNAASIVQDGSSMNYAEQSQVGSGNQAGTNQLSTRFGSFSYIGQNGTDNRATVTQKQ